MKAIFIGWQETFDDQEPFALFNVITNQKSYPHGTTVDLNTLIEWSIEIPHFPDFKTWKNMQLKGEVI